MKRLVILGFGGYGRTIEDVVLSAQLYDEIAFLAVFVVTFENIRVMHAACAELLVDYRLVVVERLEVIAVCADRKVNLLLINLVADKIAEKICALSADGRINVAVENTVKKIVARHYERHKKAFEGH